MSYGMDHAEFTAATGLADGDPVELTVMGESVSRAVVKFAWVGAGFDVVDVLYDSDRPGFPDGSKHVHQRRHYAHMASAHLEYNGPYPFNRLSPGVVVTANGKTYKEEPDVPVHEGPVTLTHLHVTLNGEPVVFHPHYLSTSCLHALHDQCKGKCKFCEERCRCDCHKGPSSGDRDIDEVLDSLADVPPSEQAAFLREHRGKGTAQDRIVKAQTEATVRDLLTTMGENEVGYAPNPGWVDDWVSKFMEALSELPRSEPS